MAGDDGTSYEGYPYVMLESGGTPGMNRSSLVAVVLALALGISGGWLASGHAQPKAAPPGTAPVAAAPSTGSFATLAEAVKPAVINVSSQVKAGPSRAQGERERGEREDPAE